MATTNPSLTSSWSLIVAAGSDFLMTLPFFNPTALEIATTASDSISPTVSGHTVSGDRQDHITRSLVGPGSVWARSKGSTVTVVLNTWVP